MIDLDKTLAFYASALKGLALRQRVTAHNIANQNTPGYRAKTVRFEEVLSKALRSGEDLRETDYPLALTPDLTVKANGNNVSLENEWMQMEQTRMLHEVFARAAGGTLRGMLTAIRGR